MYALSAFAAVMLLSAVGAGLAMARRGESWRTWSVLGMTMGPLVVPYARQHLGIEPRVRARRRRRASSC